MAAYWYDSIEVYLLFYWHSIIVRTTYLELFDLSVERLRLFWVVVLGVWAGVVGVWAEVVGGWAGTTGGGGILALIGRVERLLCLGCPGCATHRPVLPARRPALPALGALPAQLLPLPLNGFFLALSPEAQNKRLDVRAVIHAIE